MEVLKGLFHMQLANKINYINFCVYLIEFLWQVLQCLTMRLAVELHRSIAVTLFIDWKRELWRFKILTNFVIFFSLKMINVINGCIHNGAEAYNE